MGIIGFRQYPLPVDKVIRYCEKTYPQLINNLWIIIFVDKLLRMKTKNMISKIYRSCNVFCYLSTRPSEWG